jgi:fucose 4-O-acetylase-like acetyltransferase
LVAYHVIGASSSEGLRVPDNSPWRYFADTFVYLRMPLFTFLSGVVYALRPVRASTRLSTFTTGKMRRLLVPMLIFGTAYALAQTFLPGANDPISVPWYLWNIIPVGPYWFLISMMWVFVAVAVLEKTGVLNRLSTVLGVIVAAFVVDAMLPPAVNFLGWRTAFYLFPFFIVGLAASRFRWRTAPGWAKLTVAAAGLLLGIYSQLGLAGLVSQVPARHSLIAGALGSALCLTLMLTRWSWGPLVVIGGFSFTIYTAQVFGVGAMRLALNRLGVEALSVSVLLCIAAGIVLPMCLEIVARRSRTLSTLLLGKRWSHGSNRRDPSEKTK